MSLWTRQWSNHEHGNKLAEPTPIETRSREITSNETSRDFRKEVHPLVSISSLCNQYSVSLTGTAQLRDALISNYRNHLEVFVSVISPEKCVFALSVRNLLELLRAAKFNLPLDLMILKDSRERVTSHATSWSSPWLQLTSELFTKSSLHC